MLLSFVPQAMSDDQKCFTGTVLTDDTTLTKDEILNKLWPGVGAAIVAEANANEKFNTFLKTRGVCQMDCLSSALMPTIATLYGKLGGNLLNHDANTLFLIDEALTGAFRACYPAPPLEEIKEVASKIRANIGMVPETTQGFPNGVACANKGSEDEFHAHEFMEKFKAAFKQSVEKNAEMKKFFETVAKDCQVGCLDKTVPASALALFLTANHDEDKIVDALTGAIHACFPGVPHEDINALVADTKSLMVGAQDAARLRLYSSKMPLVSTGSMTFSFFAPLCGVMTAAGLLLFVAGVGVGRRCKQGPRSQVEGDEVALMESQ